MKKKDYLKPTMQIVQLKHQSNLFLLTSEKRGKGDLEDYDINDIDG